MTKSPEKPNLVLGYDLNDPEQKHQLMEHLNQKIEEGASLKEALGITDNILEEMYQLGYSFYNSGDYSASLDIFRHLLTLDPKSYRFALGAAASCHRLKDFANAITLYMHAHYNDPTNPMPTYYCIDCCLNQKDTELAIFYCDKTIELTQKKSEFTAIREDSEILKASLKKQLK